MARKALVLDGSEAGDAGTAAALRGAVGELENRGFEVRVLTARDLDIGPCLGCFGCWTKTPGECVVRDDATGVIRAYLESEALVYVTPVVFGAYPSALKKVLDRIIPVLDPRFTVAHGQIHHRLRYARLPRLMVIGTLAEADAEAAASFANLVKRNGFNFHQLAPVEVLVSPSEAGAAHAMNGLLDATEVAA
jgi:multimeric flavodoxin WrbA